jgi:hypothetical protein
MWSVTPHVTPQRSTSCRDAQRRNVTTRKPGAFTVVGKTANGEGSVHYEPDRGAWRATYRLDGDQRPRVFEARRAMRQLLDAPSRSLLTRVPGRRVWLFTDRMTEPDRDRCDLHLKRVDAIRFACCTTGVGPQTLCRSCSTNSREYARASRSRGDGLKLGLSAMNLTFERLV